MSKTIEMQARKALNKWYRSGRTAEGFQRRASEIVRIAKSERAIAIIVEMDTLSRS
jgi:hypothetical protein